LFWIEKCKYISYVNILLFHQGLNIGPLTPSTTFHFFVVKCRKNKDI
jgi:hypothetical protein